VLSDAPAEADQRHRRRQRDVQGIAGPQVDAVHLQPLASAEGLRTRRYGTSSTDAVPVANVHPGQPGDRSERTDAGRHQFSASSRAEPGPGEWPLGTVILACCW